MDPIITNILAAIIQLIAILTAFWVGSRKLPLETRKMSAEEKSIQAQTIQTQGKTLADAFAELDELRKELETERDARLELERELKRWRSYAARLQKQIVEHFNGVPVPFDTPPAKP